MVYPANSTGMNQFSTPQGYAAADRQLTDQLTRDTTQQLQVPQGPAEFDHWAASGNFVKGATVGFLGNTLGAVVNNPLLAVGAITLGVLVPPAGVAMAGAGLLSAGMGAIKSFAKSKELADKADQLKRTDPYNMQQAALLYRLAEDQYNDVGSNTTGALTSALSLGWMARGSAARAVTRGDMTPEQLAAITDQKGVFGNNLQTLKENWASVTRKSEWVDSPGFKKGHELINQWRDRGTVKPDVPEVPAASFSQPPQTPTGTTVNQYLRQNRHAQSMLETMQRASNKLDNALKTLESGRGNLTKTSQQAIDAADELSRYSSALKKAAAEGHFTEDLPPALTRAMDDNLAKVANVQTRLGQLDDINLLRQNNPQLDKLLRDVDVFENGRGSKLQDLLGTNHKNINKRGNWAEELQQTSEGYRQQLEHILNTQPDISPTARQVLSQKIDQLGQMSKANQTLQDMIWLQSAPERSQNKFAFMKGQKNSTGFSPWTDQQIQQSPWSTLGYEMDRLRKLTQNLENGRLNANQQQQAVQAIEASRQQALNIIDQGLLPQASNNNQQMQLLNSLRQGVAQDPGVQFLQQPLAASSKASPGVAQQGQQVAQQLGQQANVAAQQVKQQARQSWDTLVSDPAARQSAFQNAVIGGNLAHANRGWLNPQQDLLQQQQQQVTGANGMQPGQPMQQTSPFGGSNSTSEPVGDYGRYVVLNLGRSNYRIFKAANANQVTQAVYDKLPLAERPYYTVDNTGSQSAPPLSVNQQPGTSNAPDTNKQSVSQTWWRS